MLHADSILFLTFWTLDASCMLPAPLGGRCSSVFMDIHTGASFLEMCAVEFKCTNKVSYTSWVPDSPTQSVSHQTRDHGMSPRGSLLVKLEAWHGNRIVEATFAAALTMCSCASHNTALLVSIQGHWSSAALSITTNGAGYLFLPLKGEGSICAALCWSPVMAR